MSIVYLIVAAFVGGGVGGGAVVHLLSRISAKSSLNQAQSRLSRVNEEIKDKKRRAEEEIRNKERELEVEKKEKLYQLTVDFEKKTEEESRKLHEVSERLIKREEALDKRLQVIEKGKELVRERELELIEEREKIATLKAECKKELERIAGMSADKAKKSLLDTVKKEAEEEAAQIIQEVEIETKKVIQKAEQEAKKTADEKAREIIAIAIQRCAVDEVDGNFTSTVSCNDEMKGRVIGREGRNIKSFQALTGVDLIMNSDTPETVVLSCYDSLRRKIAQISLERLIADSRIHPGRIEEIVEKAKKDVADIVHEEGQRAAFDMGIPDLHTELINLLGSLKFRTSYGQNVLQHSKEVANIAAMMASELGVDPIRAKRAGFLHDIGKAVIKESNGSHATDGAKLVEQCGESEEIVHAIAAHHEDEPIDTVLASLIQAADAISASRPGARKEVSEKFLKRVKEMEEIACSFEGVNKAYAIQAGRELRVFVVPEQIDDKKAEELSRKIADKIESEKELNYPGQITITVIRELRYIDYAK